VGFLALVLALFSCLAFWAAHKAFSKEPPMVDTGKTLIRWGIISLVPALLGIVYAVYRLVTTGNRKYQELGRGRSLST
jgi:hypothetical protein